jgi:hypothetical protein
VLGPVSCLGVLGKTLSSLTRLIQAEWNTRDCERGYDERSDNGDVVKSADELRVPVDDQVRDYEQDENDLPKILAKELGHCDVAHRCLQKCCWFQLAV